MNPRDLAGNTEEKEEEEEGDPRDIAGNAEEEEGEAQRYSLESSRRRRMMNPRDIAGNAEEEGEP